jgi:uncharacterized protein YqgC (DUF456 family)
MSAIRLYNLLFLSVIFPFLSGHVLMLVGMYIYIFIYDPQTLARILTWIVILLVISKNHIFAKQYIYTHI